MCHLSEMQAFWYKRLLLKDAAALGTSDANAFGAGGAAPVGVDWEGDGEGKPKPSSSDWKRLQVLLMQVRSHICD